ncbi:putative RNA recognition motif domain, nucleotide-binding alpha-beta plait domain superfamily [Helianthus annuus]|nr:putative RNA recognition motif domain, nucleotide-binding alpha-beta plait domain superfamily [Helianthus annuus]
MMPTDVPGNLSCMILLNYLLYIDIFFFNFQIKIAFIRNLPSTADENYLKLLFGPFGKVEKVVVHNKGASSVGFIHFTQRSVSGKT